MSPARSWRASDADMRQVFSSPRLENVEAVAAMLREHDIEIRISNGRSYRSAIRGNFSYRDTAAAAPTPAVWVLRADQQPLARQVLRDAGLLQSARNPDDSFLPPNLRFGSDNISVAEKRQRSRLRYILLAAIAAAVGLVLVSTRRGPDVSPSTAAVPPAAQTRSASASPENATPTSFVIPTPPALAETLFRRTLANERARKTCLAVDGADPTPELLSRLAGTGAKATAASACDEAADALWIEASRYRTDGSGSGTIELVIQTRQAGRTIDTDRLRLTVQREGDLWRVLDES